MIVKLVTSNSNRRKCRYLTCQSNPDFITPAGRIKSGTTCAAITTNDATGFHTAYYCRECIDKVYKDIKAVLNSDLWIFK